MTEVVRYADRPELREQRRELDDFPEFMFHNAMGRKYWDRLYTDRKASCRERVYSSV